MTQQNNSWAVGAVIVIYFPDQEVLGRLLRALAAQVAYMAVVDNGAKESTRSFLQGLAAEWPSLEIFFQGQNVGVAAAHNVGIARMRTRGCTHVLLLDQDSIPAPDMVEKLLQACLKRELGRQTGGGGGTWLPGSSYQPHLIFCAFREAGVQAHLIAIDRIRLLFPSIS